MTGHHRLAWTIFWVVSMLALGAGVAAALTYGDRADAGTVILGGVCLVGIAAAILTWSLPPFPEHKSGTGPFAPGGGGLNGGGGFKR